VTPNSDVLYRSDPLPFQSETGFPNRLNGRDKKRLERAREAGYLDARCRNSCQVKETFGLWCWRLKIPMVWFERHTPRSKYGRVHLEMFTTANRLTTVAQAGLQALSPQAQVSSHNVRLERIPLKQINELARAVFRAATRGTEPNRAEFQPSVSQAASA
jgi:hypothetical protein